LYASASKEVYEYGLYLVVLMVGYTHVGSPYVVHELLEVTVSQFAGCHLYAYLMSFGIGLRVEVYAVERYAVFAAQLLAEAFVAVAFLTAQMEVAMYCFYPITQLP
jgi:hypothetical protein